MEAALEAVVVGRQAVEVVEVAVVVGLRAAVVAVAGIVDPLTMPII